MALADTQTPFTWGSGGRKLTPEQVAREREIASALMAGGIDYSPVAHWTQGLARVAQAGAGAFKDWRASQAEEAGLQTARDKYGPQIAALLGGNTQVASIDPVAAALAGTATDAASGMAGGDFLSGLVNSESGGNWNALNSEGYGGRLQFGDARLADAAAAGVVPPGMTGANFSMMPPEVQQAVEQWHFNDIDQQAANMGLNQYFGQTIGGVPINADSIRAMAHLGGIGGAQQFITSGGQYNPADSNGTRLSDYGAQFGGNGGPSARQQIAEALFPIEAYSDPWAQQLYGPIMDMALKQRMQQQDPRYQQQMRQADLDYQMGEARLAAMSGPDWQTIQTGDGDYYRYDGNDPNSTPSLWFDAPAAPAGSGNLGTTIYTGRDASGNVVPMQVGPDGSFVPTTMPDGIRFDPGALNAERAYGSQIGTGQGKAVVAAPEAIATAQRTLTQIQNLKDDPGLWWSTGNMGWTPNWPGNPQAGTISRIEQLQGAAFLEAFESLKGGGQITEVEGTKATNAIARLQRSQSYEEFVQALTELEEVVQIGLERAQRQGQGGAPMPQFGGAPAAAPAANDMGNDPMGLF
jgi:hypothetical protein